MSPPARSTSLLGQALALVAGAVLLVLGFMFSLVVVTVFIVVGLALGAWFFWKTRHLRKAMREAGAMRQAPTEGQVIEGEAVVVEEYRVGRRPQLPEETPKPPAS